MKVAIGSKIIDGPWGGGNLFLKNLHEFLEKFKHQVVFDLEDNDIDLILFTDPRKARGSTSTITGNQIKRYLSKNKTTVVVQRINECDERKGTKGVNKKYLRASKLADHVVLVSSWLRDIYILEGLESTKSSVILSGSNKKFFNQKGIQPKSLHEKFKIITHHWSDNWMKGFEAYKKLDTLIEKTNLSDIITFTYLGNFPKDLNFTSSEIIPPKNEQQSSEILKKHHIYITGSLFEPSGNHHIEAAQCGLPILYINSGGTTEYCKNYGLEYTIDNLENKIYEIVNSYDYFKSKLISYPNSSDKMCLEYLELFKKLVTQKKVTKESR